MHEHVHRADLGHDVLLPKEPQHLRVPGLLRRALREHPRRVVPPDLVPAHPARPRALVVRLRQDLHRGEPLLEVRANRARDDEKELRPRAHAPQQVWGRRAAGGGRRAHRALARVDPEHVVGAERGRADVEREAVAVGDLSKGRDVSN